MKHFPARLLFILLPLMAVPMSAYATTIRFFDSVTPDSMQKLVSQITVASAAGDRNITVELDSGGGDLNAALWAADKMKKYNVNTSVYRDCSSACTILFAAGIVRSASYEATFMFHPVKVHEVKVARGKAAPPAVGSASGDGTSGNSTQGAVDERPSESVEVRAGQTFQDIGQIYAERWLQAIRDASPALADILQKKGTLEERGRQVTFTGREASRNKFAND